jgi:hypothetical protein
MELQLNNLLTCNPWLTRGVKGELLFVVLCKNVPHCGGSFHPQKVGGFHPFVCVLPLAHVLPLFFKLFALDEYIN